jgi:UDP-2-acetamido-3-amino-2,3-dideoxy-glucuronate N-acetyltransferase
VFTNVKRPKAGHRAEEYAATLVKRGAVIGANATIVCGVILGDGCFVGAGAVVTRDVMPGEEVVGVPARPIH